MNSLEWNLVVCGTVICLYYSCLLGNMGRTQEVRLLTVTGLGAGVVGVIVLTGMALVRPSHNQVLERNDVMSIHHSHNGFTDEGYPKSDRFEKLLSIVQRTNKELGQRPTKDHVAHEDKTGKLSWVTKQEYKKLITGK